MENIHPVKFNFGMNLSFRYGYTCYDCEYLNKWDRNREGQPYCSAWHRYIDDTDSGDRCSRRSNIEK